MCKHSGCINSFLLFLSVLSNRICYFPLDIAAILFFSRAGLSVSEAEVLSQDSHEIPLFPCTSLAPGLVKVTSSSLSIQFSLSLSVLTKMSVSTWRLEQDRVLSAADYVWKNNNFLIVPIRWQKPLQRERLNKATARRAVLAFRPGTAADCRSVIWLFSPKLVKSNLTKL